MRPDDAAMPIGVDIGSRWIKLVQARPLGRGRFTVGAAAVIPRPAPAEPGFPPGAEEAQSIADAILRGGFVADRVSVVLPHEMAMIDQLELPPSDSGAPVEALAASEAAALHACEPAALEVRCWELPRLRRSRDQAAWMTAACRRADLDAMLDALEEAGLDPVHVGTASWATAEAVRASAAMRADPAVAVLDLGWRAARLAVLRGPEVIFERELPDRGLRAVVEAVAVRLGVEPDLAEHLLRRGDAGPAGEDVRAVVSASTDSLREEVARSVAYAAPRVPEPGVARVLVTGGGAACGITPPADGQLPCAPATPATLLGLAGRTPHAAAALPQCVPALGMSIWGCCA